VTGKDNKRLDKRTAQSKVEHDATISPTTDQLRAALDKLQQENLPQSPQEKENYFMSQVGLGEQLTAQGKCEY
jgi:mitochondrial import receptor subunit TOM20